ncbi:FliI/YscN family ATPase [bacterium]|nr:FliI/YscN family ATPase [bacterium]
MQSTVEINKYSRLIDFNRVSSCTIRGQVRTVKGLVIEAELVGAEIGSIVNISRPKITTIQHSQHQNNFIKAQVVGFENSTAILLPYSDTKGLFPGASVEILPTKHELAVGNFLLGKALNSLGEVITDTLELELNQQINHPTPTYIDLNSSPPPTLQRQPVNTQLITGIRALDGFCPIAHGQRLAIFAEPGVGKSSLMTMLARSSAAEINIIALIGERSREVGEFHRELLKPELRNKTILVVSTSDEPALSRATAALTATRIAEYFRDQGKNVLLQIDSLTRLCRAMRDVGLAAGEMPVRRGYPPSVFAALPKLLERAGTGTTGSITAFYTMLLSADIDEDPMVEEVKGILDGHIILSRRLAERSHYPAIDILRSLSRLQTKLQPPQIIKATQKIKKLISRLENDRDLLTLGGKADSELQSALQLEKYIEDFLVQNINSETNLLETNDQLREIANAAEHFRPSATQPS